MSDSQSTDRARASARPAPGRRVPGSLGSAKLASRTMPVDVPALLAAPRTGSVAEVCRHKRALLITYRRNGRAVPTPVWAAEAGGRLYVRTERTAGKVKRLRKDPRLLVAPCTMRGRPLGAPFEASARVLPANREPIAERALAQRYGLGRAIFERTVDLMRVDMCYLEIVADGEAADTGA